MYRKTDHKTRVSLDVKPGEAQRGKPLKPGLRTFTVDYDADGNPLRIKERFQKEKPVIGFYETTYWSRGHHPAPVGSLAARVIAAADEKRQQREQAAADATS